MDLRWSICNKVSPSQRCQVIHLSAYLTVQSALVMGLFEPEVARPIKFLIICFYRNGLSHFKRKYKLVDRICFCCLCCFLLPPPAPSPKAKRFWGKQTWCCGKELSDHHPTSREGLRARVWACVSQREKDTQTGREGRYQGREWRL